MHRLLRWRYQSRRSLHRFPAGTSEAHLLLPYQSLHPEPCCRTCSLTETVPSRRFHLRSICRPRQRWRSCISYLQERGYPGRRPGRRSKQLPEPGWELHLSEPHTSLQNYRLSRCDLLQDLHTGEHLPFPEPLCSVPCRTGKKKSDTSRQFRQRLRRYQPENRWLNQTLTRLTCHLTVPDSLHYQTQ